MWLKFNLNFVLLKCINRIYKALSRMYNLLGKIYFFRAADCVYHMLEKLDRHFDRQYVKCKLLLTRIKESKD